MRRMFTESHSVYSTRFDFLQKNEDCCSRFQWRPLDLRLSTGNFHDDDVLDSEEVNLSLSMGRSTNKRSGATQFLTNNDNFRQDHLKLESSVNCEIYQDWSSSNQGSNTWHDAKKSILIGLDLNKSQPDESSFHSNQSSGPHPSCNDSYGESCSRISKPVEVSTSSIPTSKKADLPDENKIQKAAISLQQHSTKNQDSETETKSGSTEIENIDAKKKKTTRRSSSIDSYESLVLKLEESCVNEDFATSNAFEMNELDKKENGIKLRRGSRMKDFQKDILPIISSLSRQEIWEDINILEGVIRSREYKRLNKAKTGKGGNWFTPVRSKRSKVDYVSRKN